MARKKKPDDQPDETNDQNAANDDTFGLPEIEYEPISRESFRESPPAEDVRPPEPKPAEPVRQPEYTEEQPVTNTPMERDEVRQPEYSSTYYDEDEDNSPWPKILGILALLLIIAGAGWYFGWKRPHDVAVATEQARQEEQARLDANRANEERAAEEARLASENKRLADSVANATPPVGTIETLNQRTGRYYVVVASAIDGDLLMDYAKELSKDGISAKVIPPYGKVKFHRLTVAEGETFASTQQIADQLKTEYTEGTWVIKY